MHLYYSMSKSEKTLYYIHVRINNTSIISVRSVRLLGVYLDADITMRTHAIATVRSYFAALRQIHSIRRSLPRHALLTLIRALLLSKVDYSIQC